MKNPGYVLNCSSISTWYPLARRLVSFAIPTTAMSSAALHLQKVQISGTNVCPRKREREFKEVPQTPNAGVGATFPYNFLPTKRK